MYLLDLKTHGSGSALHRLLLRRLVLTRRRLRVGRLCDGIVSVLSNPVQLCTMCLAVLSVFIDPTTAGITDSETALTYTAPKKKGE